MSHLLREGNNLETNDDFFSWVFSSELAASSQSGHNIYNPSRSSSARVLGSSTWSISYGDGSSASGNVYTDKVAVGASVVSNQAVELAQQVSASFVSDTNDGLLGLAFDSINTGMSEVCKWFEPILNPEQSHRPLRRHSSPMPRQLFNLPSSPQT